MSTSDPFLPLDPEDLPRERPDDPVEPEDAPREPQPLGEPQPGADAGADADDEAEERAAERERLDGGPFRSPEPGRRLTADELRDELG